MKFIAIGRGDFLYNSITFLVDNGHQLAGVVSDVGAPEYKIQLIDFQKMAEKHSVPFVSTSSNIEISNFLSKISDFEVGISGNHRRIISELVLERFNFGVLNLHGGDLPRYRGNACQAWAILNGESQIAACVHRMLPDELDAGQILARAYLEINQHTKILETWEWLVKISPGLFLESLNAIESNPNFQIENSKEKHVRNHRCHERRPEDGRIDWRKSAIEISRLVNASGPPYFGAFTYFAGKTLKILDARVGVLAEDISAIPGQVVIVNKDYVSIACGDGVLDLTLIQYDGIDGDPCSLLKSTRMRLESTQVSV
jgi:UDP-4-amino-4-deoxy-L-arabinose formyltransferase/UDP-glucuronic acid dehydrogenase (UDP-4-keto-hexauronic acid decarboxylating)